MTRDFVANLDTAEVHVSAILSGINVNTVAVQTPPAPGGVDAAELPGHAPAVRRVAGQLTRGSPTRGHRDKAKELSGMPKAHDCPSLAAFSALAFGIEYHLCQTAVLTREMESNKSPNSSVLTDQSQIIG
jgi:hypothetical protein